MLAVVKIAGQQFKVQAGQSLYVSHLQGNTGDKVEFSDVLLVDNGGAVSVGSDVKATVKAEIISALVQGDKVIAFKMTATNSPSEINKSVEKLFLQAKADLVVQNDFSEMD